MSYRITTNGLFRAYGGAMRRSQKKVYNNLDRVQTGRTFSTFAEDPASAAKAFRLRRDYWRTDDHLETSNYLLSKFQVAYTAAGAIVNGDDENPSLDGIKSSLAGLSDASASSRRALGNDLSAKADSIVMSMNVRYNEEFVFAGTDGLNVPFQWGENDTLLYRGIDVNAATGSEDYARLEKISDERAYVDIGLGMEEDSNGNTVENSAFNSTLSGLKFLGFGTDEEGDSLNMVVLMKQLGQIYSNSDPDSGEYANPEDKERALVLVGKLHDAINRVQERHVELSSDSTYLETNKNLLETAQATLAEQIDDLEQTDEALAITQFMWAQYSYQAALQVGTKLLSQSLLDYLH